jgi:DNA polymerase III subunit delta'
MTFDSFIGNGKVIERLRSKLQQNRFPHGLIFSGPEGVGKHTCALMIAKALNCTGGETQVPPSMSPDFCDECPNCHKINSGTHPDVMMIGVEEEASQIKIAQIRRILAMLDFQPLEGRNKIFIIDPADLMNSEAANALLKGLEEPPENSYFILVTVNVQELLLTVRSRCQVYNFSPLTLDEIRRLGIDDELLVRWSQGSIGRARSLDMAALKKQRAVLFEFLRTAVTASDTEFREMLASSADVSRSKQDFPTHLGVLTVLLSDLLHLAEGMPGRVVNVDMQEDLEALASRAGSERLVHMADFLRFIESSLKNHVNRQMLTDVLALVGNESTSKILNDNPRKTR